MLEYIDLWRIKVRWNSWVWKLVQLSLLYCFCSDNFYDDYESLCSSCYWRFFCIYKRKYWYCHKLRLLSFHCKMVDLWWKCNWIYHTRWFSIFSLWSWTTPWMKNLNKRYLTNLKQTKWLMKLSDFDWNEVYLE